MTTAKDFLDELMEIHHLEIHKPLPSTDKIVLTLGQHIEKMLNGKAIVINDLKRLTAQLYVSIIEHKDDLINHFAATQQDKYYSSALSCQWLMSHKAFTLGNAYKYLSRYITTGFDKSANIKDLYKAIHYIYFYFG